MPNNIVKFVENFRWPIIAVAIICPYYYSKILQKKSLNDKIGKQIILVW
jgi:hypothetical protein